MMKKKPLIFLVSLLLIISLLLGGVLAYMFSKTKQLNNQFDPAQVTCQVNAYEDGSFDVTNTGKVKAYIRAAIAVNWMDAQGNVSGIDPAASDYTLTVNDTDWWQDSSTGYYYYKYPVNPESVDSANPDNITNDLITGYGLAANVTAPTGYELCVEVVAEAIQADGTTDVTDVPAYKDAWEIDIYNN